MTELEQELVAAMPPPADDKMTTLSAERHELAQKLAQHEATRVHAESSRNSLQQEVQRGEAELLRLRGSEHAEEQRLTRLNHTLSSSAAAPAESVEAGLRGAQLLDALQVGTEGQNIM